MNYYERHIGDYLKDTAHLSLLEHGVYTRLLDVYYTREGGIPAADAARLIGARSREERAALSSVIGEFFELRDGLHMQDRCEREVERYAGKQAKAKASADARWNAHRSQSERNANASRNDDDQAMRTHSERSAKAMHRAPVPSPQSPDTRHQTPETGKPARDVEPRGGAEATQPLSAGTAYGIVAKALREAGIEASPGHQRFRLLVDAGATAEEFLAFAVKAKDTHRPFEYVLGCVEGERKRATKTSADIRHGPPMAAAGQVDTATRNAEAKRLLGFGKPATPETSQEVLDA